MQKLFYIPSSDIIETHRSVLSVQIGSGYIGYAITTDENHLLELGWYASKATVATSLQELLNVQTHLTQNFSKLNFCIDSNSNVLMPTEKVTEDFDAALYLNNHNVADIVLQNQISSLSLSNIYSVPYQLHEAFPEEWIFSPLHLKTLFLNNLAADKGGGNIALNIMNNHINVIVSRDNKLLIAQSYHFSSPDDVLFYLLKICEIHDLKQREVVLKISGLIDRDSSLYKALYQYFLKIEFESTSWEKNENNKDFTTHLFRTLNLVSLCES
ncbi:MAG: DUF3822 family protein [Sphingobacteriales bacterium]|nr:DUF3822 family protein [Sphingobacteriales bacterium]